MILVQVVVHIMDRIDCSLGVPVEYRLGGREGGGGHGDGLLSDPCSAKLLKTIIRQEEKGGDGGGRSSNSLGAGSAAEVENGGTGVGTGAPRKGPVSLLRENIKKTTQLLQSNATFQVSI